MKKLLKYKFNSKKIATNFRMLKYKRSRKPICIRLVRLARACKYNLFSTLIFKIKFSIIPKKFNVFLKKKQEPNLKFLNEINKLLQFKNNKFKFDFLSQSLLIKKYTYKNKLIFFKKKKFIKDKLNVPIKSIFLKFKLKNKHT